MDKRIGFRFYEVTRDRRARMTFGEALTQIGNIRKRRDREQQLAEDFYVRAEIIDTERGAIVGEMTRIFMWAFTCFARVAYIFGLLVRVVEPKQYRLGNLVNDVWSRYSRVSFTRKHCVPAS